MPSWIITVVWICLHNLNFSPSNWHPPPPPLPPTPRSSPLSSLVGTIATAINRPSDAAAGEDGRGAEQSGAGATMGAIWRTHFRLGAVPLPPFVWLARKDGRKERKRPLPLPVAPSIASPLITTDISQIGRRIVNLFPGMSGAKSDAAG